MFAMLLWKKNDYGQE